MGHGSATLMFVMLGGFIVAFFVIPRAAAWLARVIEVSRKDQDGSGLQAVAILTVVFLHSGPWLLVVASALIYGMWSSAAAPVWHAFFAGLVAGCGLVGIGVLAAYKIRQKRKPPPPLTPELLRKLKRRSMVRNTVIFSGLMIATAVYSLWNAIPDLSHPLIDVLLIIWVLAGSTAAGLYFAWFMWQMEWSVLGERDWWRRQAEKKKSS